jgi:hypothetical protein
MAIHAEPNHVLVSLEYSLESETPSMVAVIEHRRDMAYKDGLAARSFKLLELLDEPFHLVARIIATIQDVEVILVACKSVDSDHLGVVECKAILKGQILRIIAILLILSGFFIS